MKNVRSNTKFIIVISKIILFIHLLILNTLAFSQNKLPQYIPPTPTAYQLGKYGDIPVSLYTGVPNISIPIYNLKNRDVSVDVSINYHAGGIKVDEEASFVGLGWSLSAGGVITRVVKGAPDGIDNTGKLYPERANIKFFEDNPTQNKQDFINNNKLEATSNLAIDPEPDVFIFNFMGKTGKFYFDKDGLVVFEKELNFKVDWTYVDQTYSKFSITDDAGIIYEFSNYETTYSYGIGTFVSAWYLSKVTSPIGNVINFIYYNAGTKTQVNRSVNSELVPISNYGVGYISPFIFPDESINYSEIRIKEIVSDAGKIEFIYSGIPRKDISTIKGVTRYNDCAIDKIVVKNPSNKIIKTTQFVTSYFEANDIMKYNGLDKANYNYLNFRLRLDAVKNIDEKFIEEKPFLFYYNGDDNPNTNDEYTLPHRLSFSQDHWGYYNYSGNTHLFPGNTPKNVPLSYWCFNLSDNYLNPSIIVNSINNGANREVNQDAIKAGMIKKIQYPTAGETEFEFEANDYKNFIGGVRIKSIKNFDSFKHLKEKKYLYESLPFINPNDFYYDAYSIFVKFDSNSDGPIIRTSPDLSYFSKFGADIPSSYLTANGTINFVKINVTPQAVLGGNSNIGYETVEEIQDGMGKTISSFISQSYKPDITNSDFISCESSSECELVSQIFKTEYLDPNINKPQSVLSAIYYYSGRISVNSWPYPEVYNNGWKRGELLSKTYYNNENSIIQSEFFDYKISLTKIVPGYKVVKLNSNVFVYVNYLLPSGRFLLSSKTITEYDKFGKTSLVNKIEYKYDNPSHQFPTRIINQNYLKTTINTLTYPLDYANGTDFIDNLKLKNLVSFPIEKTTLVDNGSGEKIIGGLYTEFQKNGTGLKLFDYSLELNQPINIANFKFSNKLFGIPTNGGQNQSSLPDVHYKKKINYSIYDSYGNLNELFKTDDNKVSYLWGYNFQYPVSQITNSDFNSYAYTSFEADASGNWDFNTAAKQNVIGGSITGNAAYTLASGNIQKSGLNSSLTYKVSCWIKEGSGNVLINGSVPQILMTKKGWKLYQAEISNAAAITISGNGLIDEVRLYPAKAQMSSFTYEPLIGMTSKCDVNNRIEYYEYDSFGRLKLIRDFDGNIIKSFDYQYQANQ